MFVTNQCFICVIAIDFIYLSISFEICWNKASFERKFGDVTEMSHYCPHTIHFSKLLETLSNPALFLTFNFPNACPKIVGETLPNTICSVHGFELENWRNDF